MISPSERCAQQVADAIARNIYAASPRSARHTCAFRSNVIIDSGDRDQAEVRV